MDAGSAPRCATIETAQLAPDPAIPFFQCPLGLGQHEVRHPATQDRVELINDFPQAASSRTLEYFSNFIVPPLQAGRRYLQFRGFVPRQAILPQKLPLPRSIYYTLGRIDRELELLLQKPGDTRHNPLTCPLASDIDVTVIRITAGGMASTFQFPNQEYIAHIWNDKG